MVSPSRSSIPAQRLPRRSLLTRLRIAFVRVLMCFLLILLGGMMIQWMVTRLDRYQYPPTGDMRPKNCQISM
jgi:hypothetical protein